MNSSHQRKWTEMMSDEDLAFIERFILASGSLKDVAAAYGISYPTVRLRLDRLIAKIEVIESQQIRTDFERMLRSLYAEGKIDMDTMRLLLRAHEEERGEINEDINNHA